MKNSQMSVASRLAQISHYIDPVTGAIVPPIHASSTFARDENYELTSKYTYARYQTPIYDPVEQLMAELDDGSDALLFASGLAVATAVFETVKPGQQILAPIVMYHGLQDWLRRISKHRNIELTLYDATDHDALRETIQPGRAAIVWVETLLNPTWDVVDIEGTARIAHNAGAILAVDSTVTPPVTTKPLELGADIVFHSATKYLNGHSDITGGVLVSKIADERWEEIKTVRKLVGGVMGPFEAWLLLRGLRTLALRYQRSSETALRIAQHLANHAVVEKTLYPGLPSHPGYEIASAQMFGGFGGMLSLCVKGGAEEAIRVATAVKMLIPATSLGGVESLIEHRASVEGDHSTVAGNLLRLSIGIEDVDDLISDLDQALESVR
ncbi:MAG: trans-sulfuration enzyme family protein [Methyloligellaceae bacterium]